MYDKFAGILSEEPGRVCNFTYDESFLELKSHELSQNMPLRKESYRSKGVLHPYFDNLTAEGWLVRAQAKALGTDASNRLQLLY